MTAYAPSEKRGMSVEDLGTEASILDMTQALFLTPEQRIQIDEWHGSYDDKWKGVIVEAAFTHPAKFARGLITRMIQHAQQEGWLVPGMTVLDPFGGVALGALETMKAGCHWLGCELEPKFAELGNQNIALWNKRFSTLPHWGTARLLCGDSRQLTTVLQEQVDCCVSSPPYVAMLSHDHSENKRLETMPLSIRERLSRSDLQERQYGSTPGQLGAMKAGDFDAEHWKQIEEKYRRIYYGEEYDLIASSPPYEGSQQVDNQKNASSAMSNTWRKRLGSITDGQTLGNLANTADFWSAARAIVEQCYLLLKPGGISMWVVKSFVRKKKIVDFPHQWQALCESVGFLMLHEHHAMQTTDLDEQFLLQGGSETRTVVVKSFFRKLAEKKGSPKIDYEIVLCLQKRETR